MKLHNVLIRPTDLFEEILRRKLISGGGGSVLQTVTGISPLTLLNVASRGIKTLTQFGKCEQASTPSPSSPVDVYCNNGKITHKDDELPVGYARIESVTMNNNCYYLITDFKLKGSDTLRFSFSATDVCNVLGCYTNGSAQTNYSLYVGLSTAKYLRYNGGTYNSAITTNKRYDVVLTPTGSYGLEVEENWTEKDFIATSDFCIGTTSISASSAKLKGTLYGNVEVEDANGMRFKGIPCERMSDHKIGYYDTVSETFYEPVGTTPTARAYDNSHRSTRIVGTPEVLTICGKNLCPNKSYAVNSNSTQIGSDDADAYPFYFVGGTTYTVSYSATKKMKVFLRKNTDQGGVLQGESQTSVSFIPADSGWYRIVLNNSTGYASANVTNIQVEVGSTATDYEAYTEQTASVENLLGVGDYKDEQEIISGAVTHKVGVKVFDGTENWTLTSSGSGCVVFSVDVNAHSIQGWSKITSLCTHFGCYVGNTSPKYIVDNVGKFWLNTAGQYFRFVTDGTMSLSQFKAFLAEQYANGTPVIVVYPLAEATTEQVTAQHLTARDTATITAQTNNISDITLEVQYWQKAE